MWKRYAIILVLCVVGSAVASPNPADEALRAELLALLAKDQRAMGADQATKRVVLQAGADRLKEIVSKQGWPRISQVGKNGAQAAWLLAQHADFDVPFQEDALSHMEALSSSNEVNLDDLAYMRDRVAHANGKAQVYGTQGACSGNTWTPFPIANPAEVDAVRASMGLGSIADYISMASRHMCSQPVGH